MSKRERQILNLILEDPMVSQQSIAERLNISRSAVAGHVMRLTNKGVIKGRAYVVERTPFVAVVGGANVDLHGRPAKSLALGDSNPGTVTTSPGGVGRNVAENIARLGAEVRLISAVGNDTHGRMLLEHGREAGVDMGHVLVSNKHPTATYMSVLDQRGDMHVAVNDMAIMDELDVAALSPQQAILNQASIVVADANLSADALRWLGETTRETPLFVDAVSAAKSERIANCLGAIHTLKCNQAEAEALSGFGLRNRSERNQLADWFHSEGVQRLFVTLGRRGVFYSSPEASGIEKTTSSNARNTGGAGDAFLAGISLAWLEEWPLLQSIRFALAAARVTVTAAATSSPTISRAAVERAMA